MISEDRGLERPNFYTGQLLTADDLTTEQNYRLQRCRRHNRYLHGWGVVSGLSVEQGEAGTIVVSPGMAIDCYGNEIYLDVPVMTKMPQDKNKFYVVIEYLESKTRPVPCEPDPCSEEEQRYSRIREECHVSIADIDPGSGHNGIGPGTKGCGQQHPLAIACFQKVNRRWKVVLMSRR